MFLKGMSYIFSFLPTPLFFTIHRKLTTTFFCDQLDWVGFVPKRSIWGCISIRYSEKCVACHLDILALSYFRWVTTLTAGIGRIFAFLFYLFHEHNFSSSTFYPSNFFIHCLMIRRRTSGVREDLGPSTLYIPLLREIIKSCWRTVS